MAKLHNCEIFAQSQNQLFFSNDGLQGMNVEHSFHFNLQLLIYCGYEQYFVYLKPRTKDAWCSPNSYLKAKYDTHATITRFWLETALEYQPYIHKARILWYKPLEKTFLDFKKWVKSIQTAGCNGARTVDVPFKMSLNLSSCRNNGW